MRFNKKEKFLIYIFFISIILMININFIYTPMKEKEENLNNTINKIEISKKILKEKDSNKINKENLILDIEDYLKSEAIVNYIEKENTDTNKSIINIKFSGIESSITNLINNIDSISNKIYLNNIEIYRLNEDNVECKMQITMYTY